MLAEAVAYTDSFKAEGFTFYGGYCTGGDAIQYFKGKFGEAAIKPLGSGRVIEY